MSTLISICIASYNYAEYLYRGFDAIKAQNFDDIEIIYCDDCSTDNSVEVINDIIKNNRDYKIRLIQNEKNQGLNYTKTRLIYECTGEYLMFCDADDWMAPNCLKKLAAAVEINRPDRVISEVYDIGENGKIKQIQDIPKITSKWLWNLNHGCIYKTSILKEHQIKILGEPDDVYLITKFNPYSRTETWIREPLYYWYIHEDSAGRQKKTEEQIRKVMQDFGNTIQYIDETPHCVEEDAQLELLCMKIYYLTLYHTMKKFSLKRKLQGYKECHKKMTDSHPDYLKNIYLKKKNEEVPLRSYAIRIIKMSVFLERFHLIKLALVGYHFCSKFIYFDQ